MANVCSKCGNNLYGNKSKCPFCGEPIHGGTRTVNNSNKPSNNLSSSSYQNNNTYSGYNQNNNGNNYGQSRPTNYDTGSGGWGLLGFCFPIVGIILFLVWQNDQPNNAKVALNGALIGFVVWFLMGFFNACAGLAY